MAIIRKRARSLAEVFQTAREVRDVWNSTGDAPEEIWYRGQSKKKYRLLPGLYRAEIADRGYDELSIVRAFEHLAQSYVDLRPATDWEWYFLAQHYRLPTRLLDWTESLLAALYFALADYWSTLDKREFAKGWSSKSPAVYDEASPTIWILDAGTLNKLSQGYDMLFAPNRREIAAYLPSLISKRGDRRLFSAVNPIALHPPRQNARIIAQQGVFTVHGRDRRGLDVLATKPAGAVLKLAYIQLDRSRLNLLIDELLTAGIGRLALFPDLDSAAEHVKWHYRD